MKKPLLIVFLVAINLLTMHAQMNVVKLGMGELLTLKPSIQYERILNERTSTQLTLNFRPSVQVPSLFYEGALDVSSDPEFRTSGFAMYPEFRYYTGFNIPPEGFYLGFQGKYLKTNIDFTGIVLDNTNSDITGSIKTSGGGLLLGYQWLIKEKVTIDFYFLGLTLQKTNISGTVTSDDPNANFSEMEMSLEESVEDLFFLHRLEVTSGPNGLTTQLDAITLGVRTGLSFGIAF